MPPTKKVQTQVKLQIEAGKATPAPPVGPDYGRATPALRPTQPAILAGIFRISGAGGVGVSGVNFYMKNSLLEF